MAQRPVRSEDSALRNRRSSSGSLAMLVATWSNGAEINHEREGWWSISTARVI
jgi:hypothetical protein